MSGEIFSRHLFHLCGSKHKTALAVSIYLFVPESLSEFPEGEEIQSYMHFLTGMHLSS